MQKIALNIFSTALILACLSFGASAQETYLMPEFREGMIFFNGQMPAQGKLNICAVDNTLRFLDKSGKEMVAANEDNIVKVRIDTVWFIHNGGLYYRMYRIDGDTGIALKRDVRAAKSGKQGAYGTTSQTASIRENANIYADGVSYNIDKTQDVSYENVETLFLYKGDEILVFNKRSLRKLFPQSKDAIEAYFKGGGAIPATVREAQELLSGWK